VDKLKLKLLKEEKEKIFKRYTDDHEAHNLYLKGRYFWYRRYEGGLQKGLELDPDLGEAYASLGWISMFYDWDWQTAERELRHAIKLNPYYAPARLYYSMCLDTTGRFGESIGEMKKAQELDPLEPLVNARLGLSLYLARRYEEAYEQNRKVISMDPNFSIGYWYQAMICATNKLWDEAIASSQKHVQLSGGASFALATLGFIYGSAGIRDEALNALERLTALSQDRYISLFNVAMVYVGLGEKDQALENLEKAHTDRASLMAYLGIWPVFDSVRSEPRFKALLKKMNLELIKEPAGGNAEKVTNGSS